ncbi:DUF4232 domain-containing protein [Streptomyces sp. MMG1121]|uniref:DUF4232 domain-containing protein n=1 Tax=Streptomyces sp. MMG1121 TaxID=1415544 RepID=UPI0006AE8C9A|nr:DUF4232 domain-containing protein [Streptomyces sp. MMG1121]KOV64167.1 Tat pathway signal sequence domain protein [Streptomyces sp. MMG1121]
MRIRAALAVPVAAAAVLLAAQPSHAVTTATAPTDRARPVRCAEASLTVRAKAVPGDPAVVRMSVANPGARACAVDRVPTVTFGNLDGAALPVPAGSTGGYRLAAGATVYADVRTIADPADREARRTDSLTVAASAAHRGRSFTAGRLGTGTRVLVWEPVTTWWQPTAAAADRAIGLS